MIDVSSQNSLTEEIEGTRWNLEVTCRTRVGGPTSAPWRQAQPEKISQRFFDIPSSPPSRPHNHFHNLVPRAALLQHPSHDEFQEVEDAKSDRSSRGEHLSTTIVVQI